jgi:hypothetical protein
VFFLFGILVVVSQGKKPPFIKPHTNLIRGCAGGPGSPTLSQRATFPSMWQGKTGRCNKLMEPRKTTHQLLVHWDGH